MSFVSGTAIGTLSGGSRHRPVAWLAASALLWSASLGGCETLEGTVALGLAGATAGGARTPSHEIEQTYYLGVFDPQSQVEPTVYRVRLHGQASFLNAVQFASGWLPSIAVDSIGTRIAMDKETGLLKVERDSENGEDAPAAFQTSRRLVVFGPEGFREAPADQRLVVAMGANPDAFFQQAKEALQVVAAVTQTPSDDAGAIDFKNTLLRLRTLLAEDRAEITEIQLLRARDGK